MTDEITIDKNQLQEAQNNTIKELFHLMCNNQLHTPQEINQMVKLPKPGERKKKDKRIKVGSIVRKGFEYGVVIDLDDEYVCVEKDDGIEEWKLEDTRLI